VLVLIGCVAFTAMMVRAAVMEPNILMVSGALLFGFGVVASALYLIPGRAYLRVAADGLVVRAPFRVMRFDWNDVENFSAYEISTPYSTRKCVGFDWRELTPERQSFLQTLGRGIAGVDMGLPDTYGLDHHELAALLNDARARYATEHGISPSTLADLQLHGAAARVRKDRLPVLTVGLALICVAVFTAQTASLGLFPSAQQLQSAGGISRAALTGGAWWTLVNANLLHANVFHLVFNLLGLGILGTLLEREVGWARVALLYLISGVCAMGLAVLMNPRAVIVGVSGVIFAVAAWGVLRDTHRTRGLGTVAWGMLPAGVIYTFFIPGTSIGGHLGGFLAGLAVGRAFERSAASETVTAKG